ncbi:uncharacterized protein LOC114737246 [Neltuma alba]|uniref:uncharacterized protein LOC114737246 n=1 Tax=Neltuma alba TaxID=207710 RepID=UPI0010A4FDC1|nr:uncharacterized protein LOC114737246 [Prosopis alba]
MGSFETLKVRDCQKIQHIFPMYMNGVFATLQTLKVKDCNSVQEIFQLGGKEMCSGDDTTQLKSITLLRLPKLKQIWSTGRQSSLHFKSLQVVRVEECGDLDYLFPFSIAKHLPQLEAITIKSAAKMKEIVSKREEPLDNLVEFEFSQLTSMALWDLQDLQRVCAGNHSLSCSSLRELDVCNCQKLKLFQTQGTSNQGRLFDDNLYVSMRRPLFRLEEVAFRSFNHLELSQYPELKELWYGQPEPKIFCNLKHLVVRKCSFLSKMIFSSNLLQLLNTLEELEVSECDFLEAIFDVKALEDKAMESREIVIVDKCNNLKYVFSPSLCQNLRQLEELHIDSCGVEEIISTEEGLEEIKCEKLQIFAFDHSNSQQLRDGGIGLQIKQALFCIEKLEHIWNDDDSASHPLVQNLEYLRVEECSKIIRFATPSASFKNLTSLTVNDCNGLMYFMTTCTATSLVHLTSLEVSNCGMLEEVVMTDDEGESEEEVIFESLKYLELTCLTSLKSFCYGNQTFIFPSLVTLKVIGCHKMQNFSSGFIAAPFVKSVKVEDGKKHWKGDLNSTIKQLFIDKAIGEGIDDDHKESSSSQTQEKSIGKSRALSIEEHGAESKADDEVVDLGKQEIHGLPIPHTGILIMIVFYSSFIHK